MECSYELDTIKLVRKNAHDDKAHVDRNCILQRLKEGSSRKAEAYQIPLAST